MAAVIEAEERITAVHLEGIVSSTMRHFMVLEGETKAVGKNNSFSSKLNREIPL